MTSRERMRAAMTGGRPDRVPFFPCIFTDHACVALGHMFEEALTDPRLGVRWMAEVGFFYGCDVVRVRATPERSWFEEKEVWPHEGKLAQVDRRTGRVDGYFDVQGGGQLILLTPPPPVRAIEQIEAIAYPSADQLLATGCLDTAREMTREAHERGLFVVGMAGAQTINTLVARVGSSEEALMLMATELAFVHRMFRMATDASIEMITAFARIGVDCVYIGDSYASGSVISPQMYREFCVPAYRRAADAAHALGLLVYKHCCGNYNPLLPLMDGNHLDGMEGLDPTSGMTVAHTREVTGGRLCLIGGVSCLSLLQARADQVYAEAMDCIRAGGTDGRFVLGSACAVPRYTPVENMQAMARAAMDSAKLRP
jgi:uroporphyrinogen-III decarboxylase